MKTRARRFARPAVVWCQLLSAGLLLGAGPALARTAARAESVASARTAAPAPPRGLPVDTPVYILNIGSGKCLDDTDDSKKSDTIMTQQGCVGGHSPAQWLFQPVPINSDMDGFFIKNVYSNMCLDDVTPATGHKIVQKPCNTRLPLARQLAQVWAAIPVNGQWALINQSNGESLAVDVHDRSIHLNGDPIDQEGTNLRAGNQMWHFKLA
jgi:hypothetical protein